MKIIIEEMEFTQDEIIKCKNDRNEPIEAVVLCMERKDMYNRFVMVPLFAYNKQGMVVLHSRYDVKKCVFYTEHCKNLFEKQDIVLSKDDSEDNFNIKENISFTDYCQELFANIKYAHAGCEKEDSHTVVVKYKNGIGIVTEINASFRKLTEIEKEDFVKNILGQ